MSTQQPVPFDESQDPNPFWKKGPLAYEDSFDPYLPRKGFLTDLVYFYRGTEVPTIYTVWAGLYALSSIIKREAWLHWFPSDLYCNLYVMLVGPAGCKKNSAIELVLTLMEHFKDSIKDHNIRKMKRLNIIKNKATPEAILAGMTPIGEFTLTNKDGQPLTDKEGKKIKRPATSEIALAAPEMTVLINKQKYTESMIQNLTDLYDPQDRWEWRIKGEIQVLRNIYTTLIAGTTPEGFREGIPPAAAGDGFLSRTIVAYHHDLERCFIPPRKTEGGPSAQDIAERLAYIAQAVQGKYYLSERAQATLETWYKSFQNSLKVKKNERGFLSRTPVNLLKVAFLLKAQRYPEKKDKEITEEDIKESEKVLNATLMRSREIIVELKDTNSSKDVHRVKDILKKKGALQKSDLIRASHLRSDQLAPILTDLQNQGTIKIKRKDVEVDTVELASSEVYIYDGDSWL